MPIWLIVLLIIVGICLVGFGVWYGVNNFKTEDKPSNITPNESITCGDKTFVISKDSKEKVPETLTGPGWTGGSAGINYYLNEDNSLDYETWTNFCEKYDENSNDGEISECLVSKNLISERKSTGYKCEYLFENDETFATGVEDPITYGICYSNGKYYEIGLHELTCSNDVNSCKLYIENITQYCKMS